MKGYCPEPVEGLGACPELVEGLGNGNAETAEYAKGKVAVAVGAHYPTRNLKLGT